MLAKAKKLNGPTLEDDADFVEYCYHRILRRNVDQKAKSFYLRALGKGHLSREMLVMELLQSEELGGSIESAEFVNSGHFYSAVPSKQDREMAVVNGTANPQAVGGIDMRADQQFELLTRFKEFYLDCPFTDTAVRGKRYCYQNPAYSYMDAYTLHCIMRLYKPERVIEVGSGYSSAAMLDVDEVFFNNQIDFTFIEPYADLLRSLLKGGDTRATILEKKVQDVDLGVFSELKENDILFIDSTHVSKLGSDVNRLLFDVLPELNKGVLVHFHDIFWPFEYPSRWIQEGRAWNEAYLLRSFMQFNDHFEMVFFSHYIARQHGQWLQENLPLALKNPGGNFWLRKSKD